MFKTSSYKTESSSGLFSPSIHSSMALSYYSNWGEPFQQQMDSDIAINGDEDPELQALLHGAWNADCSFFNPNDFFFSDQTCNNSLLHHHFTNELLPFHNSLPPFPTQEIEFHCPPKRQKLCDSDQIYSSLLAPDPFLAMLQDYQPPPEMVTPPPFLDFPAVGYNRNGSCESARKEEATAAAVSLSTQSAAARQRRRRITEKTQELGKLVPGGQKMNTAEMLQSAYKYIKFLQAQVALLDFVGLNNQELVAEEASSFEGEEMLQILLESPLIQEKLYSTENCLVPHKFVDEKIVKSNPNLLKRDQ